MISCIKYSEQLTKDVKVDKYFFYDSEKLTEKEAKYHIESGSLWNQYGFIVDQYEYEVMKKLFDQVYEAKLEEAFTNGQNNILENN
mgnify:CR=1 FL=1